MNHKQTHNNSLYEQYMNTSSKCKKDEKISNLIRKLDKAAKEKESLKEEIEYLKFRIHDLTNKNFGN
jgi:polyhydroxyalkanoate synthesis regulator phasin